MRQATATTERPDADFVEDGPPLFACCGACVVWVLVAVGVALFARWLFAGRRRAG